MNKLIEKMRALGSKRSAKKAAAARRNGLKGGRPAASKFEVGARVKIIGFGKRRGSCDVRSQAAKNKIVERLNDHNQHVGRVGIILEIAPHEITWRYKRHVWRERIAGRRSHKTAEARWRFHKTAETREVERTISYPNAVCVRFNHGVEIWFPRYQVRLASSQV